MFDRSCARDPARRFVGLTCVALGALACTLPAGAQLYRNSVASNDIDFITEANPSAFDTLEFVAVQKREMPDKRPETPEETERKDAYVFLARFTDNTRVVIMIDAAFGSEDAARAEAMRYVHPLGKLPTSLRHGLKRGLAVHHGGGRTTAFSDTGLIIIYSDIATTRIANHDLEETIFHESVHASWDRKHARSEAWIAAQEKDGGFVTGYAREEPKIEDLAETALFAYTILHHPDRLPAGDVERIRKAIPNRIAYIARLVPPGQPIFTMVERSDRPVISDAADWCKADIRLAGVLADVLSNALRIDYQTESNVLRREYDDGEELFRAVVAEKKIEPEVLKASIRRHLHVNCTHERIDDSEMLEEINAWKAPPIEEKPGPVGTLDRGRPAVARSDVARVISELRWVSWALLVGVMSNLAVGVLGLRRLKAR